MRRSASARVILSSTCDADARALELGASSERVSPASSRALDAARTTSRRLDGRRRARPSPSCFARVDVDATGGTTARHRVAAAARAGARRDAASRHPGRGAATDAARISLDATSRVPRPIIRSAASTKKRTRLIQTSRCLYFNWYRMSSQSLKKPDSLQHQGCIASSDYVIFADATCRAFSFRETRAGTPTMSTTGVLTAPGCSNSSCALLESTPRRKTPHQITCSPRTARPTRRRRRRSPPLRRRRRRGT